MSRMFMSIQPSDIQQMEELASWLEENQSEIPNADRLIHKLRENPKLGHLVNAQFVKKFHEDKTYKVTDVEASDGNYDIDIQLDNKINIQTWHGASIASHNMMKRDLKPGGVPDDWIKNEEIVFKKLDQLPDDKLGIVLLFENFTGVSFLPEWWKKFPDNKCVIKLHYTSYDSEFKHVFGEAIVYHSDGFGQMEEVKKVIRSIGFNLKAENIP